MSITVFLVAANVVLWLLFFITYKKKFSAEAILARIKDEVNALLMDIRRETDMSATIIKGRIDALEALIAEADSRITLAQKNLVQRQNEQRMIDSLANVAPAAGVKPAVTENPPAQKRSARRDSSVPPSAGLSLFDAEPSTARETQPAAPRIFVAKEPLNPVKPIKTRVLELAAAGFSTMDIAEKLQISITEARLIVDLYAKTSHDYDAGS